MWTQTLYEDEYDGRERNLKGEGKGEQSLVSTVRYIKYIRKSTTTTCVVNWEWNRKGMDEKESKMN
jgi:hypothetical protein